MVFHVKFMGTLLFGPCFVREKERNFKNKGWWEREQDPSPVPKLL